MQAALDGTHRSATRGWFRDVALRGIDFGAGRWHRRGIEGRPDVLLERVAALLYTQKYESTDRAAALLSVLSAFSEYSSTPPTGGKGGGDTYTYLESGCPASSRRADERKKKKES